MLSLALIHQEYGPAPALEQRVLQAVDPAFADILEDASISSIRLTLQQLESLRKILYRNPL